VVDGLFAIARGLDRIGAAMEAETARKANTFHFSAVEPTGSAP
jgi:hypothetical protein